MTCYLIYKFNHPFTHFLLMEFISVIFYGLFLDRVGSGVVGSEELVILVGPAVGLR